MASIRISCVTEFLRFAMFDRDAISGTRLKGLLDGVMMRGERFDMKIWVANGKLSHYYVIEWVCSGRKQVSSGKSRLV